MKTVYDIKNDLDLDLFVRQVPVWQAQRRMREGRKYHDNLIYLSSPWLEEPQEEPQKASIPTHIKLALSFSAAVLCFGLVALGLP